MTDKEFDTTLERVVTLKKAQNEWADRTGKMIAQSTVGYVFVLVVWSAVGGLFVGFVLGRLFS